MRPRQLGSSPRCKGILGRTKELLEPLRVPIAVTFREYYDRFVYDADFARPHVVGFNETVGEGNTINNIAGVYPEAITVEYHFEGFDPEFTGLD